MKTGTESSAELTPLAKLIEGTPFALLPTVEADGALASRPMAALAKDAQRARRFFTDLRSPKVEQPRVAPLSSADTAQATDVSLSGRGAAWMRGAAMLVTAARQPRPAMTRTLTAFASARSAGRRRSAGLAAPVDWRALDEVPAGLDGALRGPDYSCAS